MSQGTLNFEQGTWAAIAEDQRPLSKREQFARFHDENPDVYAAIRTRALDLKAAGFARWSIEEIWNWLRWTRQCKTTGKPFSLNNNHKPFYVEKLVDAEPRLAEFFERRVRK